MELRNYGINVRKAKCYGGGGGGREKQEEEEEICNTTTLFKGLTMQDGTTAPLTAGLPEILAGPLEFPFLAKVCDTGKPASLDAKPKAAADSVATYDSSTLSRESSLENRGVSLWDVSDLCLRPERSVAAKRSKTNGQREHYNGRHQ